MILAEREAASSPEGLLVLHHGRGADEQDLLTLADVLDPDRRLHVVSPRAPLTLPGWQGYHWYQVPRVGFPHAETFFGSRDLLAELHDELWERVGVGPERTVLGGFSMGCVMSHALALDPARPAVAGVLGFSGFIPTVEGWEPDFAGRPGTRAFIAHGRNDPVIEVGFGREAKEAYEAAGLDVTYEESDAAHHIDPRSLPTAKAWLDDLLGGGLARV